MIKSWLSLCLLLHQALVLPASQVSSGEGGMASQSFCNFLNVSLEQAGTYLCPQTSMKKRV